MQKIDEETKRQISISFMQGMNGAEIIDKLNILNRENANEICQFIFYKQAQEKNQRAKRIIVSKFLIEGKEGSILENLISLEQNSLTAPMKVKKAYADLSTDQLNYCLKNAYLATTYKSLK